MSQPGNMQPCDNLRHGQQDKTRTNLDWEGKSAVAGAREEVEMVFKLMEHASANMDHPIKKIPADFPFLSQYQYFTEVI
jgi:hypothetical protein